MPWSLPMAFLHKIAEGPADKSYGIHVAKIAGLPEDLLQRADSILTNLESGAAQLHLTADAVDVEEETQVKNEVEEPVAEQLSLFADESNNQEIIEALKKVDLMNLTPMQAMNVIYELKNML